MVEHRTKIVSICSSNYVGVASVFSHGERLGLWNFVRLEDGEIRIPCADLYVFGAMHQSYPTILEKLPKDSKKAVLVTSSAGEIGFTPIEFQQLAYILDLKKNGKIDYLFFGDKVLADVYTNEGGVFFPYPIDTTLALRTNQSERTGVALFAPLTIKKNIVNILYAIKLLQKNNDVLLHTNLNDTASLMKWLGIKYKMYQWMPEKNYLKVLSKRAINLAVSWAETLNYQVVTASLCQVPSIISPTISWLNIPELTVQNPNSPQEIRDKIVFALGHKELGEECRKRVLELAEQNNRLIETLEKL